MTGKRLSLILGAVVFVTGVLVYPSNPMFGSFMLGAGAVWIGADLLQARRTGTRVGDDDKKSD